MNPFVKSVQQSRVYDVAIKSPLELAAGLSQLLNNQVYLKREDVQPVHSFKLRGAYNKMANLSAEELQAGVICASAGNHAQGVALAARKLCTSALIVMPKTTPEIKIAAVQALGGEVVLHGDNYSEAADHCRTLIKRTGRTFIHPFDDPLVIAGQATVGLEILQQLEEVDYIFVPVGGGGLIAGIASYVKSLQPSIQVIGVEPADSAAMTKSLKSNRRVELTHVGIFADGVAVRQVGVQTFQQAKQFVDQMVTVSNEEICVAIKQIFQENRTIVEPAGALGVAGAIKWLAGQDVSSKNVVCINSGANLAFERLQFIAEQTLIGSGRERLFAISLPEVPGALMTLCRDVIDGHSITEFCYRLQSHSGAHILVGISVSDLADSKAFEASLQSYDYEFTDLTDDVLSKEHLRHMVGGKRHTSQEGIYSIELPERPGALAGLLAQLGGQHNISLFHYRGLGGDVGRVLIGFEQDDPEITRLLSDFAAQRVNELKSVQLFVSD